MIQVGVYLSGVVCALVGKWGIVEDTVSFPVPVCCSESLEKWPDPGSDL